MIEQTVNIERMEEAANIFGSFDENMKLIERELSVSVVNRDGALKVSGEAEDVMHGVKAIEGLMELSGRGEPINEQNVRYVLELVKSGNEDKIGEVARDVLCVTAKGKPVKPKTLGQKRYVEAIKKNTVTLGVGPAGTGKTYLAVAAAVAAFRGGEVNRIILTRPAVEAGERLGFLPGDLQSKVDPYLRPLYDALFDMLGPESYAKYLERGNIEVAPLAYMRGRTLDDSFIILDEAQNTSREQMKMFLTDRHHRRHHPDRPARRPGQRPERGHAGPPGRGGYRHLPPGRGRCGAPCDRTADHPGLRGGRGPEKGQTARLNGAPD